MDRQSDFRKPATANCDALRVAAFISGAWGYCLAFAGVMMQGLDKMADARGDRNLKDQISASIGDAKTAGRVLLGISIVTIVARLRSIRKGS
jgi:hypothetical protein